MRLLLRAHTALHHDEQVFTLARGLVRRNALARTEADHLIDASGAARLRAAANSESWRAIWKDLKAEERLLQDEENGPPMLRVRLTGAQARAFAKRALDVVNAGRPPCPLCSLPLDPEGHVCPRQNGYRRGA